MTIRRLMACVAVIHATASVAQGQLVLVDQFAPGLGGLVSAGFDAGQDRVWVYAGFGTMLSSSAMDGSSPFSIARPGVAADDADLDVASEAFTLSATLVPAGTLLFVDGETGPAEVYAVDKATGTVLATLATAFGNNHVVGAAWHPGRNTLFLVADKNDSTPSTIAEINPTTGAVLNSFSPGVDFSVNFGDLGVRESTGNILLVSSDETFIRELTPTGGFVGDLALPQGVSSISGIGIDDGRSEFYLSGTGGSVFRVGFGSATTTTIGTTTTSSTSTTTSTSTSTTTSTTTTTSPSTTSSTAPVATTTTSSSTTSSTTSTTLGDACAAEPVAATFRSLNCRLAALLADAQAAAAAGQLGPYATKLPKQVAKAKERKEQAETECAAPNLRKSKGRLAKGIRKLTQIGQTLGSRQAQRSMDSTVRESARAAADGIRTDMRALRDALRCPDDVVGGDAS